MKQHQQAVQTTQGENGHDEDKGPGLLDRLTQTPAYHRVRDEVGDLGNNLIQELTKTAKVTVIPALMASLKNFLGQYLPEGGKGSDRSVPHAYGQTPSRQQGSASSYEPALERNQG